MTLLGKDRQNNPIQAIRPGVAVVTPFNATSAVASVAAPGNDSRLFRMVATSACHFEVGETPTATQNSSYLPAEVVEFIWLLPSDNVAFIENIEGVVGTAYLTEGT